MYTTNAIEALNAQLRKVNKKRGAFPTPESVRKVLYLAIMKASQRWSRPVQDWTAALNLLQPQAHPARHGPERLDAPAFDPAAHGAGAPGADPASRVERAVVQ